MTDHAALREVAEAAVDAVAKMSAVTSGPNAVDVVKAWRHALDAYQKALRPPTVIALLDVVKLVPRNLSCERMTEGFFAPAAEFEAAKCGTCQTCRLNAALEACGQVEDG